VQRGSVAIGCNVPGAGVAFLPYPHQHFVQQHVEAFVGQAAAVGEFVGLEGEGLDLLRKLSRCGREGHIVAQFMQASDQIAGLLLGADLVEVLRTQVLIVDPAIEYEVGRL
jgi:hypothetical protein